MSGWILLLGTMDERLLRAVVTRRRPLLDLFMRGATHLADPCMAIGIALLLASGLVPGVPPRPGMAAAATLALSHAFVEILKRLIVRPRPRLPVGVASLVRAPDRFSFPSGHAAAAMAIALPVCVGVGFPPGAAVLGVALTVGVSRCYLGVHYPGDVAAGWALACAAAAVVSRILPATL